MTQVISEDTRPVLCIGLNIVQWLYPWLRDVTMLHLVNASRGHHAFEHFVSFIGFSVIVNSEFSKLHFVSKSNLDIVSYG